jgi:outer membrane lipoprotein SlyB
MLKHVLVLALAASVALTGCAGGSSRYSGAGSNSKLTADQKVLRANAERVDPDAAGDGTVGEAVLIGAVVLGAVGCGIALLAGGDGGDCAAAGVGGAALGAAGGYVAGKMVQKEQREYASREAYLADVIDAADREIAENRRAAEAARRVTQQHQRRIDQLNAQYAEKKISRSKYSAEVAEMSVDRDAIALAVETNRQKIAELEQLIDEGGRSGDLNQLRDRRDALEQENWELQEQLEQMTALLSSTPAEVQS